MCKQESVDEMERKKEKIMLLSLQRRQQQEEAKARKEIQAMQRREKEREKEDERVRKREEQSARRAAILEHHKLKKALEEAEQKGTSIDLLKQQQHALLGHTSSGGANSSTARLRTQKVVRPRPKTIHVETGSVDLSEASSLSSRNKKGSNSNLTGKKLCFSYCYYTAQYHLNDSDRLNVNKIVKMTCINHILHIYHILYDFWLLFQLKKL